MSDLWWDIPAGILLVSGCFLSLAAGVGITRFPDLLARMHAATKPQALGIILVCAGLALRLHDPRVLWMLLLVICFQLVTSPVAAHMVGRAGYRTGQIPPEDLTLDELGADQTKANVELEQRVKKAIAARTAPNNSPSDPPKDGS